MTTIRTIKAIATTVLLSGMIIFSSCKKEDDVDPRDAYVGNFEVEFHLFDKNDDLKIEKDAANPKVLIINSDFLEDMEIEDLEAEISGGEIKIDPVDFFYNDNGPIYSGKLLGEGKVNGNQLTIEFELQCVDRDLECKVSGERR